MTLIQRIILAILFIIPVFAIGFFLTQGDEEPFVVEQSSAQTNLPAVSNTDTMPPNHPDPQAQVRAMISELEQKVAQNQHEFKDLLLLARAYMMVKDYPNAAAIYERALVIEPNSIDILLPLADVLAVIDQGKLTGRSYDLLEKVLAIDPNVPMALWLMGNAEMQLEQSEKAAKYWTTLYYIFPEGSENRMKVGQQLDAIGKLPKSSAAPAQNSTSKTAPAQASDQAIHITLDIAPEAQAKLKGTTVFIYAKSQTGMPMPIAAKKFPGEQLTSSITITEADELMPNRKLKDIAQIKVGIKISKQSNVDNKAELFRVEQALPDSRKVNLVVKF